MQQDQKLSLELQRGFLEDLILETENEPVERDAFYNRI